MWVDPTGLFAEPNEVILSFIIEKNGGVVVNTVFDNEGSLFSMTVSIGDITRGYNVGGSLRVVGGHAVIDHQLLMNHFGLTQAQATHQPGDLFPTSTDAALALFLMYNPGDWYEWGAWIHRVTGITGTRNSPGQIFSGYTFGRPFQGAHDNVIWGMIRGSFGRSHVNRGAFPSPVTMVTTTTAALFHTHPRCNCHDSFRMSEPDIWFSNFSSTTMYVATPESGLLRHRPRGQAIGVS